VSTPPAGAAAAPWSGKKKFLVGLVVGVVGLVLLVCCGGGGATAFYVVNRAADEASEASPDEPLSEAPKRPTAESVRYEVQGPAGSKLTYLGYSDGNGGSGPVDKSSEVALPFSVEVPCCDEFDYELIAILNPSTGSGPVTCRILADGKEVAKETGTGSASCRWLPTE